MASFLAVLEAVRYRLQGGAKKGVPSVQMLFDPEGGIPNNVIGVNGTATVEAYLRRTSLAKIAGIEVPIHFFDANGAHYQKVYPSLAFDIIGTNPRFRNALYCSEEYQGEEMYRIPVETSKDDVYDGDDFVGNAPRQIAKRPLNHPLDVLFEIRTIAKEPMFQALLEEYVYRCFAPRDFIRVPMKDGSYRSWDMNFQGSTDLDRRSAVREGSPGIEREYTKAYTFRVEGYFDNTDATQLANLVQKRTLTVTQR